MGTLLNQCGCFDTGSRRCFFTGGGGDQGTTRDVRVLGWMHGDLLRDSNVLSPETKGKDTRGNRDVPPDKGHGPAGAVTPRI